MDNKLVNIAHYLPELANKTPHKQAIIFPKGHDFLKRVSYTHLTFKQLNEGCDRYAQRLANLQIKQGMRVLLMVKPSLEFFILTFALFKIGAVPILIDPGMGKINLFRSIKSVAPEAIITIPLAQIIRRFFPQYFKSIKISITVPVNLIDKKWLITQKPFPIARTKGDDIASILFTTGSTGPAKGVTYTHSIFDHQVRFIKSYYNITENDIDLPCFPLFALFSVVMGMTVVIPDMDPTRPALVDPRKIIEAVDNFGITNTFGSPALWNTVANYCLAHDLKLSTIKKVLIAGAPVSGELLGRLEKIFSQDCRIETPYGATECLPVSSISNKNVLKETWSRSRLGKGTCVGKAIPEMTVRIIKIDDRPILDWDEGLVLPQGEKGEIVVKGPLVTPSYFMRNDQTGLAKIKERKELWHRMGDIGYLDEKGRIWFCGRKSHRVITDDGTLFTIPCEAIFNQHPNVYRSALVGIRKDRGQEAGGGCQGKKNRGNEKDNKKNKIPMIIIEPFPRKMPKNNADKERFLEELFKLGEGNELTKGIKHILFHPSFPVDIRHNAKIFREKLALWAERHICTV
ncbi:MAG: fatty acid CoA ligase family protein [bacterium]